MDMLTRDMVTRTEDTVTLMGVMDIRMGNMVTLMEKRPNLTQELISSRTSEERMMLWAKAIGATLLVSLAPFFILIFIPISEKRGHEDLLKVFLAFASGGLLGDAFLHLIPHAMTPHGEEHSHSHSHEEGHSHDNSVGISVLLGILAFLMVEKFVRLVKGGHSHGHSHSHAPKEEPEAVEKKSDKKEQQKKAKATKPKAGGDTAQVDAPKQVSEKPEPIKVGAYLNLAADFAHNFTDGLAIGASFLAGNTPGMVSTVIILLHEVPHEIGDFALLVQNGMTKRRAMCVQLLTAVGCLAGTILSLTMEGVGAANWVLPFTAGGFIYIATVSVIPELLENSRLWQSVKEVVALIIGVGMMMLLTEYE